VCVCVCTYIYYNDGLSLESTLKQNAECGGLTLSQFHGNVHVRIESLISAIALEEITQH
jgi:hypothetical protein